MTIFLASLALVTLAEMGDKTQFLAMAFATRFPALTVLAAVFFATLLNHALAVAAGRLLTTVIPLEVISLVAALSFILFGLWTIRGDTLEGEEKRRSAFGPFVTVAIAFFIAELGDKTQLATISLAVKYASPLAVLLGTTAGMVVADSVGIILGIVLGKRLPEAMIRLVSAGVFISFGLLAGLGWKLIHGAVRPQVTPQALAAGTVGLILLLTGLTGVHVVVAGIPWTLVLVPASLLLAAVLILLAAPVLAGRTVSDRARRLAGARVAIASGLLLVGIAVQILIEHLAKLRLKPTRKDNVREKTERFRFPRTPVGW